MEARRRPGPGFHAGIFDLVSQPERRHPLRTMGDAGALLLALRNDDLEAAAAALAGGARFDDPPPAPAEDQTSRFAKLRPVAPSVWLEAVAARVRSLDRKRRNIAPAAGDEAAPSADTLTWAVDRGAPLEARSGRGKTPLLMACGECDLPLVLSLLARGADARAESKDGGALNAVMGLPWNGHVDALVEALLAHGADPNAEDLGRHRRTALHPAAEHGLARTIERLAAAGADVNHADTEGHTPLALALAAGKTEAAEVLRRLGAVAPAVHAPKAGDTEPPEEDLFADEEGLRQHPDAVFAAALDREWEVAQRAFTAAGAVLADPPPDAIDAVARELAESFADWAKSAKGPLGAVYLEWPGDTVVPYGTEALAFGAAAWSMARGQPRFGGVAFSERTGVDLAPLLAAFSAVPTDAGLDLGDLRRLFLAVGLRAAWQQATSSAAFARLDVTHPLLAIGAEHDQERVALWASR